MIQYQTENFDFGLDWEDNCKLHIFIISQGFHVGKYN